MPWGAAMYGRILDVDRPFTMDFAGLRMKKTVDDVEH